jgi:NAD-dependent dihydropyrimidine dehydrogenase PreA subunit
MQEGPDTICNCDPCCCIALEAVHKLKHAKGMNESNYFVKINKETCIGCGLCVKRCPMDALSLEDQPEARDRVTVVGDKSLKNKKGKVSAVNLDNCIGCGVCAYKCPTKSLVLTRRETIEDPPKDIRDYMKRVTADFSAAATQE